MRTSNKLARKMQPVYRGAFVYFPDAIAYLAHVSYVSNEQHNPGEDLHWARHKSTDDLDAGLRHLLDRAAGETHDDDGLLHLGKAFWRIGAALQKEIESLRDTPVERGDVHEYMRQRRREDD